METGKSAKSANQDANMGAEICKCPASFHLREECFYNPVNEEFKEDSKEETGTTLFTQEGKVQNYEKKVIKSLNVQQVPVK